MSQETANLYLVWSSWAYTLLTGAMVVVVFFQLKNLGKQVRSSALQGIWTTWIEIDRWFVDNHDLRPFFYVANHDEDAETNAQVRAKLKSTSEMLLDCYANIYAQRDTMERGEFERLSNYMRKVYREQPVFRRFVDNDASAWYDPSFIGHLRS
jgi:hypothetical protein